MMLAAFLAVVAFSLQLLLGSSLNVKQSRDTSDFDWPHLKIPWTSKKDVSKSCHRGFNCGLLVGEQKPPISINCTDDNNETTERWFAADALLLKGREGTTALYCPVPKIATSLMFDVLGNLGLPEGKAPNGHVVRDGGYQSVFKIVHAKDTDGMKQICDSYSFIVIRNPWDRVVSGYVDKVLTKDILPYVMPFDKFINQLNEADSTGNGTLVGEHFRPASLQCATTGEHRQTYDKVLRLEDNVPEELGKILIKKLKVPASEVKQALPKEKINDSSKGKDAAFDKSIDSGVDRVTYYFDKSDPDIMYKNFKDDIEFGNYKFKSK